MKAKIAAFIRENGLIPAGCSVVAGVSGGADSVALLRVLTRLAPEMDVRVFAAHFNHGIRGAAADADEAYVIALCEDYGVPLYRERADVPRLARKYGHTLEEEARLARYAFLERARAHFGAQLIAVAHHKDDQAESVLLHLIRGSGLAGLSGMKAQRGALVRPMLCVSRAEIEAFLEEEGIAFCTDATNFIPEGTRNRVRLNVIPYIEENINPAFTQTLCSTAELLRRDEEYLSSLARAALEAAAREGGYDRREIAALPQPLKTRAIRLALADIGVKADVERAHVEKAAALLEARTGASLDLPGARVRASYDLVLFETKAPRAPEWFERPLIVPGDTLVPGGLFRAAFTEDTSYEADVYKAYFDRDRLPAQLTVRRRRARDRFFPINAPGSRKLKEFFIDRKVPREARDIPLLAAGADVLFLPGFGIADAVKITEQTARVLRVEYICFKS